MPADTQGTANRIISLDILRGMALMGMILVHFHQKMESEGATGLEGLIGWIIWMGVEGKSWATFAFLFGAGFAILMRRLEAKGKSVTAIFLRRMLVLGAIGLGVITLTGFTILLDYAIWGVALLLIRKWSTRRAHGPTRSRATPLSSVQLRRSTRAPSIRRPPAR